MKFYICTMIKDETEYLAEWIEYHLSLGFNEIHLYEDYGSKSHKEITDKYPEVYLHKIDDIWNIGRNTHAPRYRNQIRLIRSFHEEHRQKDAWCAYIDIDEFITFNEIKSLDELVANHEDDPAICLYWKNYGCNGHLRKPEGKVLDNFTKPGRQNLGGHTGNVLKFIANLNQDVVMRHIHLTEGMVDLEGKKYWKDDDLKPISEEKYSKVYIRHYITKSLEEYFNRLRDRGDLMRGNRNMATFTEINPEFRHMTDWLNKYCKHSPKINLDYVIDTLQKGFDFEKKWYDRHSYGQKSKELDIDSFIGYHNESLVKEFLLDQEGDYVHHINLTKEGPYAHENRQIADICILYYIWKCAERKSKYVSMNHYHRFFDLFQIDELEKDTVYVMEIVQWRDNVQAELNNRMEIGRLPSFQNQWLKKEIGIAMDKMGYKYNFSNCNSIIFRESFIMSYEMLDIIMKDFDKALHYLWEACEGDYHKEFNRFLYEPFLSLVVENVATREGWTVKEAPHQFWNYHNN